MKEKRRNSVSYIHERRSLIYLKKGVEDSRPYIIIKIDEKKDDNSEGSAAPIILK